MAVTFKRATRSQAKLRLGLIGPAGSGKTYTALRIASGLGGRIAVVDTERGSASLYMGERGVEFDVIELDSYEVENFVDAINAAADGGYSTIIIDSLSHAWAGKGGILEFVDKAGKRSQGGGNFGAWRDATPRHNALVDAILGAPLHVICTLRSKVEYVVENVGGRNQVRKVGLQPVQRDGLEYEFTVVGDVTQEHDLIITKTRAAFLKDAVIREAGEDLGKQLAAWLSHGERPATTPGVKQQEPQNATVQAYIAKPARIGWLDRVNAAATVEELGRIGADADAAQAAGELSETQRRRLDTQIKMRHEQLEAVSGVA